MSRKGSCKNGLVMEPTKTVQLCLDFGQKKIGNMVCERCGMCFNFNCKRDRQVHARYHNGDIIFRGWKSERVVVVHRHYRIVKVLREDHRSHLRKVADITDYEGPWSQIYIYVALQHVVGYAVTMEVDPTSASPSSVGVCVCKIWAKDPSESMIIRRLLTAVRSNFVVGKLIPEQNITWGEATTPPLSTEPTPLFTEPTPVSSEPTTSSEATTTRLSRKATTPPLSTEPTPLSSITTPLSRDTTPPLSNRATTPPLSSRAATPPLSNRATTPPLCSRAATPPLSNRATTPPLFNRATTPPLSNRDTTPPLSSRAPLPSKLSSKLATHPLLPHPLSPV